MSDRNRIAMNIESERRKEWFWAIENGSGIDKEGFLKLVNRISPTIEKSAESMKPSGPDGLYTIDDCRRCILLDAIPFKYFGGDEDKIVRELVECGVDRVPIWGIGTTASEKCLTPLLQDRIVSSVIRRTFRWHQKITTFKIDPKPSRYIMDMDPMFRIRLGKARGDWSGLIAELKDVPANREALEKAFSAILEIKDIKAKIQIGKQAVRKLPLWSLPTPSIPNYNAYTNNPTETAILMWLIKDMAPHRFFDPNQNWHNAIFMEIMNAFDHPIDAILFIMSKLLEVYDATIEFSNTAFGEPGSMGVFTVLKAIDTHESFIAACGLQSMHGLSDSWLKMRPKSLFIPGWSHIFSKDEDETIQNEAPVAAEESLQTAHTTPTIYHNSEGVKTSLVATMPSYLIVSTITDQTPNQAWISTYPYSEEIFSDMMERKELIVSFIEREMPHISEIFFVEGCIKWPQQEQRVDGLA